MTKQEYQAMLADIIEKFPSEETPHPAKVMCEYIASLEAENAKLEKLNSAALEQLSKYACPSGRNNYGQPCNDSDDCVACWREYLGGKDEFEILT